MFGGGQRSYIVPLDRVGFGLMMFRQGTVKGKEGSVKVKGRWVREIVLRILVALNRDFKS